MTALSDLATRLEAATGNSMEIFEAVFHVVRDKPEYDHSYDLFRRLLQCEAYESAALALIAVALPGWTWTLGARRAVITGEYHFIVADGATPALALCLALVRALEPEDTT